MLDGPVTKGGHDKTSLDFVNTVEKVDPDTVLEWNQQISPHLLGFGLLSLTEQ